MRPPPFAVFDAMEGTRGIFEILSDPPFAPARLADLPARLGTGGTFSFAPVAPVERGMRERVEDDEGMPSGASERRGQEVWAQCGRVEAGQSVAVGLRQLLSALRTSCGIAGGRTWVDETRGRWARQHGSFETASGSGGRAGVTCAMSTSREPSQPGRVCVLERGRVQGELGQTRPLARVHVT